MRTLILLLLFTLSIAACAAEFSPAIPRDCGQIVCVATPAWDSPRGTLRTFERRADGWREHGAAREVLLGEHGLAWGLGLHETPAAATRRKREGDRCAPAGVFRLVAAFGFAPLAELGEVRLPYRLLGPDAEAVDDPASRFYNRIVRRGDVARPDWRSSEKMRGIPDYALGVIVAHNPRNLPGAGSCIFLHEWRGDRTGTAGCTVLRREPLRELVRWLEAGRHPVLVQAPRGVLSDKFPD